MINCLAYIHLNPLRAGLVERPEDYPWNSLGYHIQTGNKDNLSLDFGLKEFRVANSRRATETVSAVCLWSRGGLAHPGKGQARDRQ